MKPVVVVLLSLVCMGLLSACGGGGMISNPGHGQTFNYSTTRAVRRSTVQLYVEKVPGMSESPPKTVYWEASNDGATWVEVGQDNPLSISASDLADGLGLDLPHGYWSVVMIRANVTSELGETHSDSVSIKLVHHPELD